MLLFLSLYRFLFFGEHFVYSFLYADLHSVLQFLPVEEALFDVLELLIGHLTCHDHLHFWISPVNVVLPGVLIIELWMNLGFNLLGKVDLFRLLSISRDNLVRW